MDQITATMQRRQARAARLFEEPSAGANKEEIRCQSIILEEIRCQSIILGRKSGRKSGVSPSFLPKKMNRHRITRKDEPTPDYAKR